MTNQRRRGYEEGLDPKLKDHSFTKFREGGLFIVRAGGNAGLFSASSLAGALAVI